jgi:hypothetical protein
MRACFIILLLCSGVCAANPWPWHPFEPVRRPPVPAAVPGGNEIDAFLAVSRAETGTAPRPPAPPEALLRRLYLDLTGLAPSPEERAAFLSALPTPPDAACSALTDRLLADPRHAERWARHWMDVWRYSDWAGWTDGKQIRDSQPHIWRWRDWIVESLQADKGYDRMVHEMLAADELCPDDSAALRATGFLARNYKMLSREQWMEDTVKHTGAAFLGLTVGCAKCHDHMTDPLKHTEYYALRAIFEPHQVRVDHLPGQADTTKDGLARVYDADLAAATYVLTRGDEKQPQKDKAIAPAVPVFLGGVLEIKPVELPREAVTPQRRESVRIDVEAAARAAVDTAPVEEKSLADAKYQAVRAVLAVERLEDAGKKDTPEWKVAVEAAVTAQREEARAAAVRQVVLAAKDEKKLAEARAALTKAEAACAQPPATDYKSREVPVYPAQSSGRRLAFARWLTNHQNPLTARVAVNHVWTRHFGSGLVPSVADFGKGGRPPANPALLDWLACELMDHGWSLRHIHRLIVSSAAFRQSSAPGADAAVMQKADPDNRTLWRYPSRRLEAEAVRDNVLYCTGGLALTRGGPEIEQSLSLTSPRRSLYLRCAAEKQAEILQVFDGPSVVECYERKPTVMPQQALALMNSELTHARATALAAQTAGEKDHTALIRAAFIRFLTREPSPDEIAACLEFLQSGTPGRREMFYLTLLNHHEFLTLR